MRPLPPLTALRAFEAAARHGNFVKAAAELGVTAGAVSQHIKGLEERLGLTLFRRLARGVRLTEAGRAYLPGIADGFDRLARATLQVHESGLAGRLTLTVLPSFAAGWLVRRLPAFRARHPDIDLVIRSERQTVDLHRDEADLAIRYGLGDFANLEATHLMREEIFPVCAPALLNADPPLRAPADLMRARAAARCRRARQRAVDPLAAVAGCVRPQRRRQAARRAFHRFGAALPGGIAGPGRRARAQRADRRRAGGGPPGAPVRRCARVILCLLRRDHARRARQSARRRVHRVDDGGGAAGRTRASAQDAMHRRDRALPARGRCAGRARRICRRRAAARSARRRAAELRAR